MRRGFVRTIWGGYGERERIVAKRPGVAERRPALDVDMKLLALNKHEADLDAITFVFGEENYKLLTNKGFKCELLDKRSIIWRDTKKVSTFRHKLEAFQAATEYFDEFVFLDLDCMLVKPLPDNFWEEHYKKDAIQGSLMQYRRRKAHWRKRDARKVPCACYVYIRDKKIPDDLIKIWERKPSETEEQIMARYTDKLYGGWKGLDHYWEHFEPEFYVFSSRHLEQYCVYKTVPNPDKVCFKHFHEDLEVQNTLRAIKKGHRFDWMK